MTVSQLKKDIIAKLDRLLVVNKDEEPEKKKSFKILEYDFAPVIKEICGDALLIERGKNETWYSFNGKRFEKQTDKKKTTKPYFDKISSAFKQLQARHCELAENSEFHDFTEQEHKEMSKRARDVTKALASQHYRNLLTHALSTELKELRNEDWNKQPNLLVFTNGVFDLDTNDFRDMESTDHFTFTTNYAFKRYNEFPEDERKFVEKHMKSFCGHNPQRENYVRRVFASTLDGHTYNQHFYAFTGDGQNGKSFMLKWLLMALGDFGFPVSETFFDPLKQNGPDSRFKAAQRKRAFVCTEYKKKTLDIGLLNLLVTGDSISARPAYGSDLVEFSSNGKTLIAANYLPAVYDKDDSYWRRVRAIETPTKFVESPKGPNEELRILNIIDLYKEHKECFMARLIEDYTTIYKVDGDRNEPEEVLRATREYRYKNNMVTSFTDRMIVPGNSEDYILGGTLDTALYSFCKAHDRECTSEDVKRVHAYLDKAFPNECPRGQLCRKIDGVWKNKRGWPNVKLYTNKRKHSNDCGDDCPTCNELKQLAEVKKPRLEGAGAVGPIVALDTEMAPVTQEFSAPVTPPVSPGESRSEVATPSSLSVKLQAIRDTGKKRQSSKSQKPRSKPTVDSKDDTSNVITEIGNGIELTATSS
ncbi:hypothetical protein HDU89_000959 [Geranomyces variabilis]|nr:hypothetical protein HDU89_000959 [Geranomyces variabilis]